MFVLSVPCSAALSYVLCVGKQLLAVWDSLCQLLRVRQVSVEDVSNKSGMLLRVLHTAAFGTTWWVVHYQLAFALGCVLGEGSWCSCWKVLRGVFEICGSCAFVDDTQHWQQLC